MDEYKVVVGKGFARKTEYVKADSAQEIRDSLEKDFAYEMEFEGMFIVDISKL